MRRNGHQDHHPHQGRNLEPAPVRPWKAEKRRAREIGERVVGDRDGRAVGDQEADATQGVHRRQRHYEGRQPHLHDAERMEQADADADQERNRDGAGDRRGEAEVVGQQQGDNHADEAFDRADGEIDAAGDDDEGLTNRQNGDEGGLAQQIGDVVGGPERCRLDRQREPHDGQEV